MNFKIRKKNKKNKKKLAERLIMNENIFNLQKLVRLLDFVHHLFMNFLM